MEKIKKIYQSDNFPIYVFLVIVTIIHVSVRKYGDDSIFSTCCENTDFFSYIIERYQTWSSRIIIEISFVLFCEFLPMWIWKVINIAMFYLLAHSISELFVEKDKRKYNSIICLLLLCIPFSVLNSAGWIATMNCYLWVAATALYSLIVIKKIYKNEHITIFQSITYILANLYASNQEQMAGVLFIIYTLAIVYFIKIKKIKIAKYKMLIINYIINILCIIIILTCPGNSARQIAEVNHWYPEFYDLSIFDKGVLGITSMMYYLLEDCKLIFIILIFLISYKIYKSDKGKLDKIIGYSPLILTIITYNIVDNIYLNMYLRFMIYSLILTLIGLNIMTIFNKEKRSIVLIIYLCGVISRVVMGFSPTVYASSERTSYFLYISIVIINLIIIKDLNNERSKKWENLKELIHQ